VPRRNRAPKEPTEVTEPTPAQQAQADFVEELAEVEEHMEVAQLAEVGPFTPDIDITIIAPADTDSPDGVEPGVTATSIEPITTSITVGEQSDFPAELGEVWGRADKPDGSTVLVTTRGGPHRVGEGDLVVAGDPDDRDARGSRDTQRQARDLPVVRPLWVRTGTRWRISRAPLRDQPAVFHGSERLVVPVRMPTSDPTNVR
jgi:hypothetical protein